MFKTFLILKIKKYFFFLLLKLMTLLEVSETKPNVLMILISLFLDSIEEWNINSVYTVHIN